MSKFIPFLFFLSLIVTSCAHHNLESHFKESKTGWTKDQVFAKFGSPSETQEDSRFQYYIYISKRPSKVIKGSIETWKVRYRFENNQVVDVVKERQPTPSELDELDQKINIKKNKSNLQNDKDSRFKPL